MVSFQESISSEKKRRWGDIIEEKEEQFEKESKKQSKIVENTTKSFLGIEFHLETPSAFEEDHWKQCLDIQSGKVHFYNTMNQKITYKDPRQQQISSKTTDDQEKLMNSSHHQYQYHHQQQHPMSLELELNLPCESLRTHLANNHNNWNSSSTKSKYESDHDDTNYIASKNSNKDDREILSNKQISFDSSVKRCPSWMSFEADQQEMVAAACMRCHMLVMLCKSSPSCPNCKFMHPPGHHQSPSNLFKPRRFISTLHCKD